MRTISTLLLPHTGVFPVRRAVRFLAGLLAGGAVFAGYVSIVGAETVLSRATAIAPTALAVVVALVALEGLADSLGVWASISPLDETLSGRQSVQFALAGDFFDVLSPAGPATSEPIMARFISVTTGTGYSDALGVRSVAKYVKAVTQVLCSGLLGLFVLVKTPDATALLLTLGLALTVLLVVGIALVISRQYVSAGLTAVCTPLLSRLSSAYRERPHDRSSVRAAVDRFWDRIVAFRGTPELLLLIALAGILEQLLTAGTLWVALSGTGHSVGLLPILVVVPLPQIASVIPIPGSLGTYDLLLGGALALIAGAPTEGATAAVLILRTTALPFAAVAGGVCAASLRGWQPASRGS
jgi:uncharacterized protein (TIRG00374 family)